ncbi:MULTISPECIES: RloB family protein [unclassified Agarivorans]|uniref:RloB family protein n=1 Tax=unclassified Agarivorans TaxID=2636026 RepID=UPI0026E15FFA|nr:MULTISPECIES: RloB family protein [unclassified Agarivorans]MDO6684505.1 RloB family protein [Agarivorans sp. 3_MG-2023]MDO6714670.1 RloB family protein [Agarivorans sp. 2_MG-2023]
MPPPLKKESARGIGSGSQYARKVKAQKIDPIIIHVAYEGEKAEKDYFEALASSISKRFRNLVILFPVPKSAQGSAPDKVVGDLVEHLDSKSINLKKTTSHAGFIVIDTDHHFTGTHNRGTQDALKLCKQKGIEIAITNPCFELWQMCHLADISGKDAEFKEKLFQNRKHPTSTTQTFSKVEYSKLREGLSSEELIKLIPTALEYEKKVNDELEDETNLSPPKGLYSGISKIIDKMVEAGFILST